SGSQLNSPVSGRNLGSPGSGSNLGSPVSGRNLGAPGTGNNLGSPASGRNLGTALNMTLGAGKGAIYQFAPRSVDERIARLFQSPHAPDFIVRIGSAIAHERDAVSSAKRIYPFNIEMTGKTPGLLVLDTCYGTTDVASQVSLATLEA